MNSNNIVFANIYFSFNNKTINFGKRFKDSFWYTKCFSAVVEEAAKNQTNNPLMYIVVNTTDANGNDHLKLDITEEKAKAIFEDYKNDGEIIN